MDKVILMTEIHKKIVATETQIMEFEKLIILLNKKMNEIEEQYLNISKLWSYYNGKLKGLDEILEFIESGG